MQVNQPAITPAQIAAAVVALIAPVAELLRAFGVYDLNPAQQSALNGLVLALAGFAAVLVAADAHLRAARNAAHAQITSSMPVVPDATWTQPSASPAPAKRSHHARKKATTS